MKNLRLNFKGIFTLLLFTVCSLYASAATYYVNDGSTTNDYYTTAVGSNSNPGTASAPFATIAYAISAASSGDLINIDAGTYVESLVLNKKLYLAGTSYTVITASSACAGNGSTVGIMIYASQCVIDGLTVNNFDRGIVVDGASHVSILFSNIHNNCNYGIAMGLNSNNLTVFSTYIHHNGYGLRAGTGHHMRKFTLNSCTINDNTVGLGIFGATSGNVFDSIEITSNTFNNNVNKGLYFEKLSHANIEGNTITNNGTNASWALNNGIDINLIHGSYSDITIQNNVITGCGSIGTSVTATEPSAIAVKARDDGSLNGYLNNLTIRNNFIQGPRNGLRLGQIGQVNSTPTNVTITENNFGNAFANKAMVNLTSNTASATCNWYGTINSGAIAALISGSFTYTPWLLSGTDASGAVGFQPSASPINLTRSAGPDKTVYYGYTTPYNTTTLTSSVSGGSGTYAYSWSPGGATTPNITVAPTTTTTYVLTITDLNGCNVAVATDTVKVNVIDVRCSSPSGGTVIVCYRRFVGPVWTRTTECVAFKSVANLLLSGSRLGPCPPPKMSDISNKPVDPLLVYPNPSTGIVNLLLPQVGVDQLIKVTNSLGQVVYEQTTDAGDLQIDLSNFGKGVYTVECSSADASTVKRLVIN